MTRRFLFKEVDFISNHKQGWKEGRSKNAKWEEGRREKGMYSKFHPPRILFCFCISLPEIRGGERREFILNSTPSNLLLFFVFHSSKTQRRREKGMYSKFYPPRIFFCFFVSLFEAQRSRDESVFVSGSGAGGLGGAQP